MPISLRSAGRREFAACFNMITNLPATLMNLPDYGIAIGHHADLVVLDCRDPMMAVAELATPLCGYKRGRQSFSRSAPLLHPPG